MLRLSLRRFILLLFIILVIVGIYHSNKPLPPGLSFAGDIHPSTNIKFLADLTYVDQDGIRHIEQTIFDTVFSMISSAKQFIVVDMFLFNSFLGNGTESSRELSQELTNALIMQKQRHPDIAIIIISDPINTIYGGLSSPHFEQLKAADITVVETNLAKLRDSNPLYSAFWRVFFQLFGNSSNSNTLANPFGKGRVSLRSYLTMINFKANHRKLILTDQSNNAVALITSANPHDGSSAHGNTAIQFSGPAVNDLWLSEKAVLDYSNSVNATIPISTKPTKSNTTIQILTESKIKKTILNGIKKTLPNDQIDIAVFYLSHREIIKELKHAYQRNVTIRIILDPNKDAFNYKKNGIPNKQSAWELHNVGIPIKWCYTHGEQCHSKMIHIKYQSINKLSEQNLLVLGSANFTRRNLDDLNLETNVAVRGPASADVFQDATQYYQLIWHNQPDKLFTLDYDHYADHSFLKALLYRFMETMGTSTF